MSIAEPGVEELNGVAERALARYREELLRRVASKLIRPRTLWQPDELRSRMLSALEDPVSLDRTLKTLSPLARQLLRLIDLTSQYRWPLQTFADLLPALGHTEGVGPVIELLEAGVIYPELDGSLPVESFESWLAPAATVPRWLKVVPLAAKRCREEPFDIGAPVGEAKAKVCGAQSDGLEFLIRLAVVWQTVRVAPTRLTQAGGLFKRDLDRIRTHPLLSAAPADALGSVADLALLTVQMGRATDVLGVDDEQLVASKLPESWDKDLTTAIGEIWSALFSLENWDPIVGFDAPRASRLRPMAMMLAMALVSAPKNNWLKVSELADWLASRQPEWTLDPDHLQNWCQAFLLGLLHPLRIVEVADDRVRLTDLGGAIMEHGDAKLPPPAVTQTLLVQPNLEVVLFRQGLTPSLTAFLTRIAEWKAIGLACTLTLTPDSVYRGLESGLSVAEVQRLLERHSTRPLSDSVLEMLRSWASKRERVQVYPSAMLLEFRTADELEQALKQGLVEFKLTDRIGLVSSESQLNLSRFRLVGTRDYLAPEERCIEVDDDGLTLIANDGRADLLFGAEVRRFSVPIESAMADDRSQYRMSLESLRRARQGGVDLAWLDEWFSRRSGSPLPPTARLLFLGRDLPAAQLEKVVIFRSPTEEFADGLERWPEAAEFFVERLGPTTFAVASDRVAQLKALLQSAELRFEEK
ncbi:MAG: helicase-associated domain-containing protein [Gemmataceae bacterium]